MNLSQLLGSVSEKDFFNRYWERQPLVIRDQRQGHFQPVLDMISLNKILSQQRFRVDECKVAKEGQIIAPSAYRCDYSTRVMEQQTNNIVDTDKLLSLYARGATLVFAELNTKNAPIQALREEMERAFNAQIVTNVFLTKQHAQGFSLHYDSHDVIILQLSGNKLWSIYSDPVSLPVKSQAFGRYLSEQEAKRGCQQLFQVELEDGDLLYLPRGYMHEAKSMGSPSLHLTLGIHPQLVSDFVSNVLTQASHHCKSLRHSLPREFSSLPTDEKRSMLRKWLKQVTAELPDSSVEAVCNRYHNQRTGLSRFCTPDRLLSINASQPLKDLFASE